MIGKKNDMRITTVRSTLKDVKKEKKHKKTAATISERDKETSKLLKVLIVIMPVIMVGILVIGIWCAVSEYVRENPLIQLDDDAPESIAYSKPEDENEKKQKELEYMFRIVDAAHPIDDTYKVTVKKYNDTEVNEKMLSGLKKMMAAAEKEGFKPVIKYGYISVEQQQKLYQKKVKELMDDKGYTLVRAESIAKDYVAVGGCSEFQTGLLIKMSDGENPSADFSTTKLYRWLASHSNDYGFVVRYPEYKKSFTGKDFDATVFRYVGAEHAKKMFTYNMCIEEYYEYAKLAV